MPRFPTPTCRPPQEGSCGLPTPRPEPALCSGTKQDRWTTGRLSLPGGSGCSGSWSPDGWRQADHAKLTRPLGADAASWATARTGPSSRPWESTTGTTKTKAQGGRAAPVAGAGTGAPASQQWSLAWEGPCRGEWGAPAPGAPASCRCPPGAGSSGPGRRLSRGPIRLGSPSAFPITASAIPARPLLDFQRESLPGKPLVQSRYRTWNSPASSRVVPPLTWASRAGRTEPEDQAVPVTGSSPDAGPVLPSRGGAPLPGGPPASSRHQVQEPAFR